MVIHLYYDGDRRVNWSIAATEHMEARHGISVPHANQALTDANALRYRPDPASKSGRTTRFVGYRHSLKLLLCVIVWEHDLGVEGINGWPANATYRRRYMEAVERERSHQDHHGGD